MREDRPRKHARTVIVVFAAEGAEHVVVGAILVVVLEEVLGLGCPFDQLPPLEFVELTTDIARILGMRDEKKQDVVKQVVGREQPDDDRRYHQQCPSKVHALFLRLVCLCFRRWCRAHLQEVSSTTASHVGSSDATSPRPSQTVLRYSPGPGISTERSGWAFRSSSTRTTAGSRW